MHLEKELSISKSVLKWVEHKLEEAECKASRLSYEVEGLCIEAADLVAEVKLLKGKMEHIIDKARG